MGHIGRLIAIAYHWAAWRFYLRRADAVFCRDMEAWRRANSRAYLHRINMESAR